MGLNNDHLLGRNLKSYVMPEVTAGTFVKPTTAGSLRVLKFDIDHKVMRKDRLEAYMSSCDVLERITGREENSWSLEAYLTPSGSVVTPTPPDFDDLIEAAMGTQTNNAGSDVTWTTSSDQAMQTLSLARHIEAQFMESLAGAWVDEMTISVSGVDEPKIRFAGGAMRYAACGYSTLNGAMSSTDQMIVQTADSSSFYTNGVVKIGSDDNSGAGYQITADASRPTFTIESSISAANGAAVVPFVPTYTTTGSPIAGIAGSVTLGSTTMVVTAAEITLKNNIKPLGDIVLSQRVPDVIRGFREITGKLSLRVRKDFLVDILARREFATTTLDVVCGDTAANRFLIDCNQIELDYSAFQIPESEEAAIEVPFKALGSSGNDAFTLKMY